MQSPICVISSCANKHKREYLNMFDSQENCEEDSCWWVEAISAI
jgi:hypothetical protein